MKAKEAKELTLLNLPKANVKNLKKSEKELKDVYSDIKSQAKRGHSQLDWDYRDSHDRFHVKDRLVEDGYSVDIIYPYLTIKW